MFETPIWKQDILREIGDANYLGVQQPILSLAFLFSLGDVPTARSSTTKIYSLDRAGDRLAVGMQDASGRKTTVYYDQRDGGLAFAGGGTPHGELYGSTNGAAANIAAATNALNDAYNKIKQPQSITSVTFLGFEGGDASTSNIVDLTSPFSLDIPKTTELVSNGSVQFTDKFGAGTATLIRQNAAEITFDVYRPGNPVPERLTLPKNSNVPLGENGYRDSSSAASATSSLPTPTGAATGTPTNLYINNSYTPQSGAPGSQPTGNENDQSWLQGTLLDAGLFRVTMNPGVLNGDGLVNVGPSLIAADAWRPGGQELAADTNLFINNELVLNRGWQAPSSPNTGINLLSGFNVRHENVDPFTVDLDGDGVELRPFDAMNVLFRAVCDQFGSYPHDAK